MLLLHGSGAILGSKGVISHRDPCAEILPFGRSGGEYHQGGQSAAPDPATLSRLLMQLEEELGVQLFRRSKHRIILTEEGLLPHRRAEEIVALADKTKDDLQHREEQLTGTIAVIRCGSDSSSIAIGGLRAYSRFAA